MTRVGTDGGRIGLWASVLLVAAGWVGSGFAAAPTHDPDLEKRIDELMGQLDGADMGSRVKARNATRALVEIGRPAVPALIKATRHKSHWVRMWSAGALGPIRDPRAVGPLLRLLKDPSQVVRMVATWHIHGFARRDKRVVPAVAQMMADPSEDVRKWAVKALTSVRSRPETALPVLEKIAKNPDPQIRAEAFILLAKLHRQTVIEAVESTLADSDDPRVRSAAYRAVGMRLAPDNRAAEFFLKALNEREQDVLLEAVRGLEWVLKENSKQPKGKLISPDMHKAIRARLKEALPPLIDHKYPRLRAHALYLLAAGEREKILDHALKALTEDKEPVVRVAALKSLARIGVRNEVTRAAIVAALEDDDEDVRDWAYRAFIWALRPSAETRKALPFAPAATPEERTKQVAAIKAWLTKSVGQ